MRDKHFGAELIPVGGLKTRLAVMPSLGLCEKSLSFLVLGGVWSQD